MRPRRPRRRRHLRLDPSDRELNRLFASKWAQEGRRAFRARPAPPASSDRREREWQRIRAAIENYVPEVTPGNTTALRTRAHPFAAYIAAMHRKIHPLWGDGFLADWDLRPPTDEFNDFRRWAMAEIVLNRDGTLAKAGIVKSSGYFPYDAAVMDVIFSAAPFGRPPSAILSSDGKVYLHWRFHRDQRQCGTFGVDAFILRRPGKGAHADTTGRLPDETFESDRAIRQLGRGVRLTHIGRSRGPAQVVTEAWFQAAAQGKVGILVSLSGLPFLFQGKVVARTRRRLEQLMRGMLAEGRPQASPVRVLTARELKQLLGYFPRRLTMRPQDAYGLGRQGRELIILRLCHTDRGYKICEIAR